MAPEPRESEASPAWIGTPGPNRRAWQRFRRNRSAFLSAVFLGLLAALVFCWPLFERLPGGVPRAMRWSPLALTERQFEPPGREHWLGTDVHGRDVLSRLAYGARISLVVGIVGALVSLVIGVGCGAVAGYLGGRWDAVLMRGVDMLYALPSIVFVIVLVGTLEALVQQGFFRGTSAERAAWIRMVFLFAGLGAVSWLTMARIVRGQVLSLKTGAFVEASRALGAGHLRILGRHLLPNVFGVIVTYVTLTVPSVILYESFLSYLGLGIQPPQASLGYLIADGAANLNAIRVYWWLTVFPAGLLALALLALNLVGDGLRDAWEVRDR